MVQKVVSVNLEYGCPTVAEALQKMRNTLSTLKGQGCRAVILIHGYGSTGAGGGIRDGVRKCLSEPSLRGIVRSFFGGEQWEIYKREAFAVCKTLKDYERTAAGNSGVTVVILK
ncbi:MAG: hypothetical protein Q8865_10710 [Bacillota bacterium]|nr:hypothetical protein [Bacillota bacterium]